MLSSAASVMGVALAMLTLRAFEHGLRAQFGISTVLTPNLRVLGGALPLTVISALASSVWPAIAAARAPIEPALRQGAMQSGTGRTQHRLRAVLVVAEIAMSLTLLVACGLLLRTIYTLRHVPLGFRTDHVVVASMTIPSYRYENRDLYKDSTSRCGTGAAPSRRGKRIDDDRGAAGQDVPDGLLVWRRWKERGRYTAKQDTCTVASGDAGDAEGISVPDVEGALLQRGRHGYFSASGGGESRVHSRLEAREAIRESFSGTPLLSFDKKQAVIVGVLNDERQNSITEPSQPELEVCLPQIGPDNAFYGRPGWPWTLQCARNKSGGRGAGVAGLDAQGEPGAGNQTFTTMEQLVEDSYGSQQLAARLLEIFGGTALVLCIAGIYGLLAYLVTQRTRELGIRIALGAQRTRLMAMVLRQAAGC